jgi:hypothetical protein
MTDLTREQCEEALRVWFAEHRELASLENERIVFAAVDGYVDCLKQEGATPEAVIIGIRAIAKSARRGATDDLSAREVGQLIDARLGGIVTRAIARYFASTAPRNGFGDSFSDRAI